MVKVEIDNLSLDARLHQVTLSGRGGDFIHVLGENGAGKSSLLLVMAGLLAADQGEVTINGSPLNDIDTVQLAGFRCLQSQAVNTHFDLTVEESLAFFSRMSHLPQRLLDALDIEHLLQRRLNRLSGGETRRVHIVRVLLQIWPAVERGGGLILLDEPIQGLDLRHQHLLFRLLADLATQGNLVITSHHEINMTLPYASHVWMMKDGSVMAQGKALEVMNKENLQTLYGCAIEQLSSSHSLPLFQTYLI